jgi:hypothetical protein
MKRHIVQENEEEWLGLCREASVEQNPEKLSQLVRRISELLEARDRRLRRLRASSVQPVSKGNGVFQIGYDERLLITRTELLKNRGYEVGSALGNDQAKHILDKARAYHLFILGHAAPKETREEMVRWLKANFPDAKILALNPPQYTNLAEADYNLILNGPEEWLSIVANATA